MLISMYTIISEHTVNWQKLSNARCLMAAVIIGAPTISVVAASAQLQQIPVDNNSSRLYESQEDGFRVQIPQGMGY
jgi:hypothetical protein